MLVPQVLVCAKSPLLTIDDTLIAVVPLFVSVIVLTGLFTPTGSPPKFMVPAGEIPRYVPIPVRFTTRGLPGKLSVTVIVPVRTPDAVGVNVTAIEHSAPEKLVPQVLVCEKSPLAVMLLMISDLFNDWFTSVRR